MHLLLSCPLTPTTHTHTQPSVLVRFLSKRFDGWLKFEMLHYWKRRKRKSDSVRSKMWLETWMKVKFKHSFPMIPGRTFSLVHLHYIHVTKFEKDSFFLETIAFKIQFCAKMSWSLHMFWVHCIVGYCPTVCSAFGLMMMTTETFTLPHIYHFYYLAQNCSWFCMKLLCKMHFFRIPEFIFYCLWVTSQNWTCYITKRSIMFILSPKETQEWMNNEKLHIKEIFYM